MAELLKALNAAKIELPPGEAFGASFVAGFSVSGVGFSSVSGMSSSSLLLLLLSFGFGDPDGGLWMFVLSCIVYGIAFDFFNVSGGLYVDNQTTDDIRSSAQGMFMIMTNGLGATIGTLAAMLIVNHNVVETAPVAEQLEGWRTSWLIFAGYALVVTVLFMLLFKDNGNRPSAEQIQAAEDTTSGADGFTESSPVSAK